MKTGFLFYGLLLMCISGYGFVRSELLEESDIHWQQINNFQGPALGDTLIYEGGGASYNKWQCFPFHNANLECATYDEDTLVPSIRVEADNHTYLFDTHVEDRLSCNETLQKWAELASDGNEVCILAAQMPDMDFGVEKDRQQSLWYINQIKLASGYWNLFSESEEYK